MHRRPALVCVSQEQVNGHEKSVFVSHGPHRGQRLAMIWWIRVSES